MATSVARAQKKLPNNVALGLGQGWPLRMIGLMGKRWDGWKVVNADDRVSCVLLAEAAPLVQVPEGREEDPECDDASAEMNFAPPDVVDYQGSTSMQRLNRSLWSEGSGSSTVVSGGQHCALSKPVVSLQLLTPHL